MWVNKDASLPAGPGGGGSLGSQASDERLGATEPEGSPSSSSNSSNPTKRSTSASVQNKEDAKSQTFDLDELYKVKKLMGQGAFGCVVAGEDATTRAKVAIKKVRACTADRTGAKRLLRELRFLRELRGHSNVVSLVDLFVRGSSERQLDCYIVTDLMEADMEQIIKSSQSLSTEHVRCLLYQTLNGLRHMHRHGIVHRDLKPANLVVDSQCRLKICDLGLSRHISDNATMTEAQSCDERFTDYVVTRWYRSPELLLGAARYTSKVDMWAAGCILGEMMMRKPLFPGANTSDMVVKIVGRISPPDEKQLNELTSDEAALVFVRSIPAKKPAFSWLAEACPDADPNAVSMLKMLLEWTPGERLSVEEAMVHPFIFGLNDTSTPPPPPPPKGGGGGGASEARRLTRGLGQQSRREAPPPPQTPPTPPSAAPRPPSRTRRTPRARRSTWTSCTRSRS
uniref:Protein kinase domain-containing protein n=2 Tax=Hemiselmis andersenii TaxID=464988 RepID=A0A7S1H5N4_HEMAN|mmetsp:Transcript_41140/g.100339  ORF Transcript_41140/g.100339 Transcript_41140/m.100339 type:complete len:454 (+) Transcript_41140:87-1448(+)